jgi:polyhydroxyalkanoate synthesis repressor PhaR
MAAVAERTEDAVRQASTLEGTPVRRVQEVAMAPPRIIKKYPNRRLYDSVESRYVTLQDIRRLVVNREEFVVVDKTSNEDVTRTVLLQIIADQEQHGAPLMSEDFLSQLIRSYGTTMHSLVSSYLEQGMKLLITQQQQARETLRGTTGVDLGVVASFTERNLQQWRAIQEQWLRQMFGMPARRPDEPPGSE